MSGDGVSEIHCEGVDQDGNAVVEDVFLPRAPVCPIRVFPHR